MITRICPRVRGKLPLDSNAERGKARPSEQARAAGRFHARDANKGRSVNGMSLKIRVCGCTGAGECTCNAG